MDTGAAVTAVPSGLVPQLDAVGQPTQKVLKAAGNQVLKVQGKASVLLQYGEKVIRENVFLVENLVTPLLGKPAITKLDLIAFTDAVEIDEWRGQFPKLFSGLGTMKSEVNLELKEGVEPFAQAVPRRVAAARRIPLKKELQRMERMGVIERIEQPTEWCAPCIVVPKKNGMIRVCIDFTRLNQAILREYHPLPTTEETLGCLGSCKYFSKLDANSGYWQMKLRPEIQKLTTFITPFGRFFCKRLPFGISSAPEIYQREMQKVLEGLEGVVCQMDDVLICGENAEIHDKRVVAVLERLVNSGITLNPDKCEFRKQEVKFLGHLINGQGIHVDPEKTRAIREFDAPTNKKELRRFFGMINYLGKFSPTLAQDTTVLRQLLKKESAWLWEEQQMREFEALKQKITSAPTLVPYDLDKEVMLSTDASSYGLGAAILHKVDGVWKPVAFASRTMSTAETRYAQIEKEALAICWGCEKFHFYLAGRDFCVETDHKPLVSVLGEKELARLPLRVQRFRIRMMGYSYTIKYTPGEKLVVADALSRAPLKELSRNSDEEGIVNELVEALPIAKARLARLQAATLDESDGRLLLQYVTQGWPVYQKVEPSVQKFYTYKDYLTTVQGLIYFNQRVYIPQAERASVLKDIHAGHQGETKCVRRASQIVWWPGMTVDIRVMVKRCATCLEFRRVPTEPMMGTPLPERPWWRIAMDICEKGPETYLIMVDFYSRYIVARRLENVEAGTIIACMEDVFCMLGIPQTIVSDNAAQFKGESFQRFCRKWDMEFITSAPRQSQSNGEAERAVQTVKGLLNKNVNLQAALCSYRDTPLENGFSPAQLLFGRSMNSMGIYTGSRIDERRFVQRDAVIKDRVTRNYNRRHAVQERSPLRILQPVRVNDPDKRPQYGTVVGVAGREVLVRKGNGNVLRRNRARVQGSRSVIDQSNGVLAPEGYEGVLAPHGSGEVLASRQSGEVLASQGSPETNNAHQPGGVHASLSSPGVLTSH